MTVHPSRLLKKNEKWEWSAHCQRSFEVSSLIRSPVLAIADQDGPCHVVCDSSDLVIGCAWMQCEADDEECVFCYQSSQLQTDERKYLVHGTELLAMKYAPDKFRVYLLGDKPFVVYTDHSSLCTP